MEVLTMNSELREHMKQENFYHDLLTKHPQYRLQGYNMKLKKVVIGIINGNPEEYKEYRDHLNFRYFNTWKDAYMQLM